MRFINGLAVANLTWKYDNDSYEGAYQIASYMANMGTWIDNNTTFLLGNPNIDMNKVLLDHSKKMSLLEKV